VAADIGGTCSDVDVDVVVVILDDVSSSDIARHAKLVSELCPKMKIRIKSLDEGGNVMVS
jgi:hypothetical protein